MTPRRKHPLVDAIPPELCTVEDVKKILGLTSCFRLDAGRYKDLRRATVAYKGRALVVFNRAEVEAMRLPDGPPEGYVDAYEASRLFGLEGSFKDSQKAIRWCNHYGVPHKVHRSKRNHRAHYIFKIADVERAAEQRREKP